LTTSKISSFIGEPSYNGAPSGGIQIFCRRNNDSNEAQAVARALFPRARGSCAEKPAELLKLLAT
jgi:hypothetical protein